MMTPITVWFSMATLVVMILMVRVFVAAHHYVRNDSHARIFEFGNEREEFWIPGDMNPSDNFDDSEDL